MNRNQKKSLSEAIDSRLKVINSKESTEEEVKTALEELKKMDDMYRTKGMFDTQDILKALEVLGIFLVPIMNFAFRTKYAKDVLSFEKDYSFSTTPGRGLSSLFRF